jgi:molybdenum cofactor cytidylyltransferase
MSGQVWHRLRASADVAPAPDAGAVAMIAGLLVAAGYGRRFDPTGRRAKLEEPIDGTMVAVRTARALLGHCDRVLACVRPASTRLAEALAASGCEIVAVMGEEGMGSSIAAGARSAAAIHGLSSLLVQPADMPWLDVTSVQAIVQAPGDRLIVLPTWRGQDGHPVRFHRSLLPELIALSGERGARQLLQRHSPLRIAVDDAGVVRDVDTPGDLAAPPSPRPPPPSPTPAPPGTTPAA